MFEICYDWILLEFKLVAYPNCYWKVNLICSLKENKTCNPLQNWIHFFLSKLKFTFNEHLNWNIRIFDMNLFFNLSFWMAIKSLKYNFSGVKMEKNYESIINWKFEFCRLVKSWNLN